jgi:hypothetical protein
LVLARALSKETDLPIVFVAAMEQQLKKIETDELEFPVLVLERLLLKPWERPQSQTGRKSG